MFNSRNTSTSEPERFLISPPELKRLAAQEMSLILCRHAAKNQYRDISSIFWFCDNVRDPKRIIEVMPVISDLIKKYLRDPVALSIEKWVSYHNAHVFYDSSLNEGILNCIDDFVLKPNGHINFRTTAKMILLGDKLNSVEKFRLACLYSLADDIENIWPAVQSDPRVTDYEPGDNPMIHYWICVMMGDSLRFPGADPDSFESYLRVLVKMDWMSIEYFWNTLSADEQVTAAMKLIQPVFENDSSIIESLFLRLNKMQLRRVLEEVDVNRTLFSPFCEETWMYPGMFEFWNYVKYFIPLCDFQNIIDYFIDDIFYWVSASLKFSTLLFEFWSNAPSQLKHSFLNDFDNVESIFQAMNRYRQTMAQYYHDMRFFVAVLTELSFQSRNFLWCKYWRGLIFNVFPECLDQMMKLCLNNEDEIIQFKEREMLNFDNIENFCILSFFDARISQLNDYLNFCSSNVHYVAAMKRQIIKSEQVQSIFANKINFNLKCEDFIDLDKFIDSAFYDEEDAGGFKRKMLKSYENLRKLWLEVDKTELGVSWS